MRNLPSLEGGVGFKYSSLLIIISAKHTLSKVIIFAMGHT